MQMKSRIFRPVESLSLADYLCNSSSAVSVRIFCLGHFRFKGSLKLQFARKGSRVTMRIPWVPEPQNFK